MQPEKLSLRLACAAMAALLAGCSAGGGGATGSGGSAGAAGAGGSAAGGAAGGGGSAGAAGTGAGGAGGSGGAAGSGGAGGSAAGGSGGAGGAAACPTVSDFATWPAGKGPLDIGRLATTDFKGHTSDTYGGAGYALVFAWFGALRFTKITNDTQNNATLITAFEPYATGSMTVDNSATATVDSRAFGDLPLEIWQQNMDPRDRTLGLARADAQWASTDANNITRDARYWADDMFMITGLQVEAYRVTRDANYLNRSAATMLSYFAALQQPDGLFWHTMTSKAYWGRANGWVAAGMTELLFELPAGTTRDSVMAGFKKQMDGLLPLQINGGADDGAWRQVLDLASAPAETSCTAMFTYALLNAVRNGWLTDPKYAAAARKGWLAVANKTNTAGKLDKVCPGTGAAPAGTLASQQNFYATIPLGLGDLHGQAPLLWAAAALLRPDCPGVR
jgi:rhamnogalacturonyl hydrolase YesR